MKLFDPELNPGFDLNTRSNSTKILRYRQADGQIREDPVRRLFCRRNVSKGYTTHGFAKNVPGFMDLFDPELNPHINIETLSGADTKRRMRYKDHADRICEAKVFSVIVTLRNHERGVYKPRRGVKDPIGDDATFWSYC